MSWVHITLYIILALWIFIRGWQTKQKLDDRKDMLSMLKEINKDLEERKLK